MNWKPIAQYDALKVKPKMCVFYFKAETGRNSLSARVENQRYFGSRVCTLYFELPAVPPVEGEKVTA